MRILIVEDEKDKSKAIGKFLTQSFPDIESELKESYNSALREIISNHAQYDLILLDMTMTTFDVSADDDGGVTQFLAGRLILDAMYLREINTPVVVVTMYESFDGKKLGQLHEELIEGYPDNYRGYVHFAYNRTDWQKELSNHINEIKNGTLGYSDNR